MAATAVDDWLENLLGLALMQAMLMHNSIIISDSDSTITYQIQARNSRSHCVSSLERAHKLVGLSLRPQPNAVIILALTKRLMQNLPLPPLPRAILSGLLPAYREFKTQK